MISLLSLLSVLFICTSIASAQPECKVYFYTNPGVPNPSCYILFSGEGFTDSQTGSYPAGTYSISAVAPSGYNFYGWSSTGDINIISEYDSSTTAIVNGDGAITANFRQEFSGGSPVLTVTKFPVISIRPGEEMAFEVMLTNSGMKYADATLWFRYLPDGVEVTDKGGSRLVDMGKSAVYTVKMKANQSARDGSYFPQISADARDAQHNWYAFTIKVGGSGATPAATAPETTRTPATPQTKSTPGFDAIFALLAIAFLRARQKNF